MKKNNLSINTFSFVQIFNDSRGKTSMSLVCGFIIVVVGCIGFLISIVRSFGEGVGGSSAFILAGSGLLIGKTLSKDAPITGETEEPIQIEKEMD